MTRTLTVTQPGWSSALAIAEADRSVGGLQGSGFFRRTWSGTLDGRGVTLTPAGVLGRSLTLGGADGTNGQWDPWSIRTGGIATIAGREFRCSASGLLRRHFQWQDADGNPVLGLHLGGLLRTSGSIEVADAFANDPNLAVLGLLGIVVAKRASGDDGGASAGAAGAG